MTRRSRPAEHGFTPLRRSAEHGFTPLRRSAEHGFTLVEVMVALLIFGMIAAASVAILQFSVRAQAATGERLDTGNALARTMSLLSSDMGQAVMRPARDQTGALRPAFVGGIAADGTLVTLVRSGWENVDAAPRPGLQKVAYRLNGDTLERIAWPQLDGAAPLPPVTLLTGIATARVRFRTQGAWSDSWQGLVGVPLPQAVELTLVTKRGIDYHALFLVGTGYVRTGGSRGGPGPTPTPTATPNG